jgi:hypothetical protein
MCTTHRHKPTCCWYEGRVMCRAERKYALYVPLFPGASYKAGNDNVQLTADRPL